MKENLIGKLLEYIRDNNPDILFALEAEEKLRFWLYEKIDSIEGFLLELKSNNQPDYIIEETSMLALTKDLRPSRYNYILNLLEQEFEHDYKWLMQSGLLQHEVINIIGYCQPVFDDLKFSEENEENRFIRYAITGAVSEYLEANRVNENVSNELQQSAEIKG
jgi:predicted XRE-type DNA-binding protein